MIPELRRMAEKKQVQIQNFILEHQEAYNTGVRFEWTKVSWNIDQLGYPFPPTFQMNSPSPIPSYKRPFHLMSKSPTYAQSPLPKIKIHLPKCLELTFTFGEMD